MSKEELKLQQKIELIELSLEENNIYKEACNNSLKIFKKLMESSINKELLMQYEESRMALHEVVLKTVIESVCEESNAYKAVCINMCNKQVTDKQIENTYK